MQWLDNNKHWIFDGVGAAIIVAILGFILNLFREAKKNPEPTSPGQKNEISNNNQIIVNLHAPETEPRQTAVSPVAKGASNEIVEIKTETPVPLTKITKITPKQIREAAEKAPALMRNEIIKNHYGLTVEWKTTLFSAEPEKENRKLIKLALSIEEDKYSSEVAMCCVSLEDYKLLGIATKGTPIRVIGEIEEIGLVFNLKNVRLYFE